MIDALELLAHEQLGLVQVHQLPRQPEHFSPAEAEHENKDERRIERVVSSRADARNCCASSTVHGLTLRLLRGLLTPGAAGTVVNVIDTGCQAR